MRRRASYGQLHTDASHGLPAPALVTLSPTLTRARGAAPKGRMNGTEHAYSQRLELRKRAGEIAWYAFEAIKLRLADNTSYTPDFFVMLSNGDLECHEVKGFMREDANVKIKVAAELFPFRFYLVRLKSKAWTIDTY